MQLTTTPSIEGKHITKYCGVIAGEAILGANLFKDLFAGIRDLVGGRSATYEKELQRAREIALEELRRRRATRRICLLPGLRRLAWLTPLHLRSGFIMAYFPYFLWVAFYEASSAASCSACRHGVLTDQRAQQASVERFAAKLRPD